MAAVVVCRQGCVASFREVVSVGPCRSYPPAMCLLATDSRPRFGCTSLSPTPSEIVIRNGHIMHTTPFVCEPQSGFGCLKRFLFIALALAFPSPARRQFLEGSGPRRPFVRPYIAAHCCISFAANCLPEDCAFYPLIRPFVAHTSVPPYCRTSPPPMNPPPPNKTGRDRGCA